METGSFIGIDFGTANTTIVRVIKENGAEKVTVLGEDGNTPFAALAAITAENKVFFGSRVKKSYSALSENSKLVSPLASLIGTSNNITINGRECTPRQLAAEYLRALKRVVMKKHGVDITEAAVSFPNSFSHEAKLDLLAAAKKADIRVRAVMPEHFAAYLALRGRAADKKLVLQADWGGSRLKLNILENEDGRLRAKASLSKKIGGSDVDMLLAEKLHNMINSILADISKAVPFEKMPAAERDKMLTAAEAAKIEISKKGGEVSVPVQNYGAYGSGSLHLTEELFADMIKPLIRENIVSAVNAVMERAKLRASDIGAVVAVGGSCGLKAFTGVLKSIFGEEKLIIPNDPQTAAALGAALCGGGALKLAEDIGIMMSDDTLFPLLKKDQPAAGLKSKAFTFGVTDEADEAQVVLADGSGKVLAGLKVPTAEFPDGNISIDAQIDETLAALITLHGQTEAGEPTDDRFCIDLANCCIDLSEKTEVSAYGT